MKNCNQKISDKRKASRFLSLLLALLLLFSITCAPVSAKVYTPKDTAPPWMTAEQFAAICKKVEKNLERGVTSTKIDLKPYNLTEKQLDSIDWNEFLNTVIHNLEPFRSTSVKSGEYLEDLYKMVDPLLTDDSLTIRYERRLTKDQERWVDKQIKLLAEQFKGTDEEKIQKIFKFLYQNFPYDDTRKDTEDDIPVYYTDYDALIGQKAQCQSFSFLFYRLTRACGIEESYMVGGQIINASTGNLSPREGNHAWNRIDIDGVPYYFDCASASADYHDVHILIEADPEAFYKMPYSFFENSTDYNILFDYGQ